MAFNRHSTVLNELEMRRLQREEEIRLRQEQDREYQEALLADQRREYEKRRASEEALAAQRAREEQEDRLQRQKEQTLAEARLSVPEQPPTSTPRSEATHIRFTLPSGARMDRRFYAKDTVAMVRAFLVVYFSEQSITIERFSISTNYPKKTFTEDHDGLSLLEAGLVPQAVLMIQDLDA
jgi:FAS-associated factor 2